MRPLNLQHLREVALLFLRLGATTFGGPAAHIAVMEDEIVRRRSWLDRQEFLDLLGAANLIPGPNSTEMAIHIGYRRAGLPGLVVAGIWFILPAAILSLALAWVYVRYRSIPAVETVLYGVKPVIIAVVVQAIWGLARTGIPTRRLVLVAIFALIANALGMNELLVLFAAGLLSIAASGTSRARALALPSCSCPRARPP